jgi:hypothetical protein
VPKIAYKSATMGAKRLQVVEAANGIIAEYRAQGFELTLRQLYYQFVSRGLIPNTQRDYKNLGETINEARLLGLIDWHAIVDRTRALRGFSTWESPAEILESAAGGYSEDRWAGQTRRVEVWIEKDALTGVISPICGELQVPYFSCRGYTSQSEMWVGAQRYLRRLQNDGQGTLVLHFGDHDPSGIDMSRDIEDRIRLFMGEDAEFFEFERIALTQSQVDQYQPPPNPAKVTDSRCAGYIRTHGHESWELDALEPRVIADLIRARVTEEIDTEAWEKVATSEETARGQLTALSTRWEEVTEWLAE